jgi:hypothetical protein
VLRKYLLTFGILILAALIGRGFLTNESWERSLKQFLIPYADVYLGFFSHPLTGILLSGMMFVAGAAVFLWYWFARLRPIRETLRNAIKGMSALSEGPPGTVRAVEALDELLTSTRYLDTDWRHYKSGLLISDHPERLRSSYRPDAYFNLNNHLFGQRNYFHAPCTFSRAFEGRHRHDFLVGLGE